METMLEMIPKAFEVGESRGETLEKLRSKVVLREPDHLVARCKFKRRSCILPKVEVSAMGHSAML